MLEAAYVMLQCGRNGKGNGCSGPNGEGHPKVPLLSPGGTRTRDLRLLRPALYPAELRKFIGVEYTTGACNFKRRVFGKSAVLRLRLGKS